MRLLNLAFCTTALVALANGQTFTVTDPAGQTIVQVISQNAAGVLTTATILTLTAGVTDTAVEAESSSVTTATTSSTTTSTTSTATTPTGQQGPVGQPGPTTGTPGGPTPYTYTTVVDGVTTAIADTFTPTDIKTTPVTPTASGTILDYSSWLSVYGPPATVAAAKNGGQKIGGSPYGWPSILFGIVISAGVWQWIES
ncbi:hypothetical protein BDQ12DRAFT_680351 [Crucibulum laeve]|uniref:Uncharacterized protein n=1 Tax=Crucibulum laeve TaxID=68775 RepID=A0A5C3MFY7_9AGAR|nr:hypothetical protein BDQ12DRAFT_680351 [Crucibulum laeve]